MIEVERRAKAPGSLERTVAYDGDDVRDALEHDFHGKCYLCEGPTGGTFNIDHFRPKDETHGFPELRQAWANLFPAHGQSCNQRRPKWHASDRAAMVEGRVRNWPAGGLIDCAAPGARVEARLMQWGDFGGVSRWTVHFAAADPDDVEAVNTATTLRRIHGDEDDAERHGRTLRERIAQRYVEVQKRLNPLIKAWFEQGSEARETRVAVAELKALLARKTPYAGVLRGTLRRELVRDLGPAFVTALGLDVPEP